jgi:DNA gyrase subunit B
MTQLHAGGKFDQNSYKVSGGLHGVGVSVVNALSEWLDLRIWRDGKEHFMRFRHGDRKAPLKVVGRCPDGQGPARAPRSPSCPRRQTFTKTEFDLRDAGAPPARTGLPEFRRGIILTDARGVEPRRDLHYEGGVEAFVRISTATKQEPLIPQRRSPSRRADGITVEVAMQWNDSYHETMLCFTNNIPQRDGGTHLAGLPRRADAHHQQICRREPASPRRRRSRSPATTCAKA